jgi:hypothetical protein
MLLPLLLLLLRVGVVDASVHTWLMYINLTMV